MAPKQNLSSQYRADAGTTRVPSPCQCVHCMGVRPPPPSNNYYFVAPGSGVWHGGPQYPRHGAPMQFGPPIQPPPHPQAPPPYSGHNFNAARAAGAAYGAAAAMGTPYAPHLMPGPQTSPAPPPPPPSTPNQQSSGTGAPGPQYKVFRPKEFVILHAITVPEGKSHEMIFDGVVREPTFRGHYIPASTPTKDVLKALGCNKENYAVTECVESGDGRWSKGFVIAWGDGSNPSTVGEWLFQTPGARSNDRLEPVWLVVHPL